MQNDGNLVTYNNLNKAQWSSSSQQNDNYFKLSSALIPNFREAPFNSEFGLVLRSPNKKYILVFDQSGSLQIMKKDSEVPSGSPIWSNSNAVDIKFKFTMNLNLDKEGNLEIF